MRVVLDARPLFQSRTGLGRHIDGYARALTESKPAGYEFFLLGNATVKRLAADDVVGRVPFLFARAPKPLWEQAAVPAVMRSLNADIYHIFHEGGPRGSSRWRFIANLYDVIPLLFPQWYLSHPAKKAYYQFKLGTIQRYAHRIVTSSTCAARDVIRYLRIPEERLRVIPTPPDAMFKPCMRSERDRIYQRLGLQEPFLLSVGSPEPRKNLRSVLAAYKQLVVSKHDVPPLVLYGQPWRGRTADPLIDEHGLRGRAIQLGGITDEELVALYSGAKAFVYLSLYEGYGLPILEAMACGCPVITAAASSMPEVADNAAVLVAPEDDAAVADCLWNVVSSSQLSGTLRTSGLARVNRLSWHDVAQRMCALYAEAV